jgi:hypothetical protein
MDEVYLIAADYSRPTDERSWYYRLWTDLNERETRAQGAPLQLPPRRDLYLGHYATLVRERWARQLADSQLVKDREIRNTCIQANKTSIGATNKQPFYSL